MTEQFLDIIFPDLNTDWGGLSRDKMNEIYHLSIAHNLFPLVYTQLKKAGPNKTASSVSEFLLEKKMGFLRVVTQALRHEILEKKLVKIFRENGSPALVFKGNILAKEIYNAANTRRSTDIDLLIKIEDVQKVDSLMKEEQFTALEEESSEFWIHRKHHLVYTCPQTNTVIEIHWNFCIPGYFNLSSNEIWGRVRHDSEGIPRLSPEMMLISLLVHNSMHAFRDLRIFVDILWALHRYTHVIDWAVFSALLKKTGLVKTTYISLVQIERIWGRRVEKIEAFNQLIRQYPESVQAE